MKFKKIIKRMGAGIGIYFSKDEVKTMKTEIKEGDVVSISLQKVKGGKS